MAVNEIDSLSEELPGWGLTEREVTWLWLFLESRESIQMDECQLNSQTMRDQIARTLRRNPLVTRGLERARDRELLPEEAFSWVKKADDNQNGSPLKQPIKLGCEYVAVSSAHSLTGSN